MVSSIQIKRFINDTSLERRETKTYLFSLFLRFLDGGGMDLFLHCKERFPNKNDLLRNMMGLLGNVAEVCTVSNFSPWQRKHLKTFPTGALVQTSQE